MAVLASDYTCNDNNEDWVLLITKVSMKFHEILNPLGVVVWTRKKDYFTFELY